jgi:DNA polymerase-3 subunit chi
MTRVDFYILPENDIEARWHFGCRLIDKAFHRGLPMYVHTERHEQAVYLGNLLWSFRADSFLPHDVGQERASVSPAPIHIGYGDQTPPDHHHEIFINLSHHIPSFFSRFERVAEIVSQDDTTRSKSRERYAFYRDRGYPLQNHDMRKSKSD